MPSGPAFQRLELALGVLGLTAASLVSIVAMDAMLFHVAALWQSLSHFTVSDLQPEGMLLVGLGLVDALVIARAGLSLVCQIWSQRRFLRALPVCGELDVGGQAVRVVPGLALHAFCAGLVRPTVYVSEGVVREASPAELQAILAHEAHHRARRDPLRMLLARVISDAFRPLPPLASLADRQAGLADLAADAAAVQALGDRQPLAAALVRFDEFGAPTGHGVAPERVKQLLRQAPPESVSPWLLIAAALGLAGIAAVAVPMLVVGWHPSPTVPAALEVAGLLTACVPSYLAARRAERCLSMST